MNKTYSETRQVSDFDQVSIKGNTCNAQLFITQGKREGLTIEAPPEYLHRVRSEVRGGKLTIRLEGSWLQELEDAITSCLNKPHIIYKLVVREITQLEVQCAYIVQSSRIETPHLRVKLNGTGDFKLDWLSAKNLDIQHNGTGIMRISGQVDEQTIVLNGVGSYIAPGLECQRACVRMSGTGRARVHVEQMLDATLRGVGILEYSGHPAVSKRISGPGQILQVANVSKEAV